ncbi:MAG: hypothetical protein ACFNZO_00835, partial [Candidatus Saccharibacteria bacterium]
MATFQYIATSNGSNKIVKGEIEALGRDDAIKSITKQQLTPISIKPVTKLSNEIKSLKEQQYFTLVSLAKKNSDEEQN